MMKKTLKAVILNTLLGLLSITCLASCNGCNNNERPRKTEAVLTGFEFPEESNYYYGSCVELLDPLVIDDIGNVIDIIKEIKNSLGETVNSVGGKFFAEDEKGYTITYSAITRDGKTHTDTTKINVIKSYIDSQVKLIDIGNELIYDLDSILPEDQKKLLHNENIFGGVECSLVKANSDEEIKLEDTEIDFNEIDKAYYTFVMKMRMGENARERVVYSCGMDFYNSEEGMVWQSPNGLSLNSVITKDSSLPIQMKKSVVSTDLPEGAKAEQYYKISIDAYPQKGSAYVFSILGIHSKEYYQMFYDQSLLDGLEYTLTFDFWHDATPVLSDEGNPYMNTQISVGGDESGDIFDMQKWYTFSFSLKDLLQSWDRYADAYDFRVASNWVYSHNVSYYGQDLVAYYGNFIAKRAIKAEDAGSMLFDMKGITDFEITDLLTNEEKATFNSYQQMGTIHWTANGKEITSLTEFSGVYDILATLTLNASGENIVVFNKEVDFYNSEETGPVYFDNYLVAERVICKDETMQVEVEKDPEGRTGNYYKISKPTGKGMFNFSILGLHSETYYNGWKEKALLDEQQYILQFDVWYTSADMINHPDYGAGRVTYFYINGEQMDYEEGKWFTVSIPLKDVLKNIDAYKDVLTYAYDASYQPYVNMFHSDEVAYYGWDMTAYVGNFRFTTDIDFNYVQKTTTALVNLNGDANYQLESLLTEQERIDFARYRTFGEVSWTLDGYSVSQFNNIRGVHEAIATLTLNGKTILLYSAKVDFYDITDGLVWNDKVSSNNISVKAGGDVEIVENINGNVGKFYKVEADENGLVLSTLAKHSQEYYDYYKQIATNTNSSYKLVFDFYYTSTSYTQPTSTVLIDGKEFTLKLNEWNKVEISLESLIKNFAVYGDENNSLCDTEQANMLGLQIASEGNDVTVYLGNFITENSVSPLDNYQNDVYTQNI